VDSAVREIKKPQYTLTYKKLYPLCLLDLFTIQ